MTLEINKCAFGNLELLAEKKVFYNDLLLSLIFSKRN